MVDRESQQHQKNGRGSHEARHEIACEEQGHLQAGRQTDRR